MITVGGWIAGIFLFITLLFILPFVTTMHGKEKSSEVMGWVIGAALIGLLWLGGTTVYDHFFPDDGSKNAATPRVLEGNQPPHVESVQRSQLESANETKRQEEEKRTNFIALTLIVIALLLLTAVIFA